MCYGLPFYSLANVFKQVARSMILLATALMLELVAVEPEIREAEVCAVIAPSGVMGADHRLSWDHGHVATARSVMNVLLYVMGTDHTVPSHRKAHRSQLH